MITSGSVGREAVSSSPTGDGLASVEESCADKTVVIGIGNRYLKDDGIGIRVADELGHHAFGERVLVESCQTVDLALLARFGRASKLILVDAAKSGATPGTISRYRILPRANPLTSIPGLHSMSLHDLFDIASQTGLLTAPLTILGVEPKDCGMGEELSIELANALPRIIFEVLKEISGSLCVGHI